MFSWICPQCGRDVPPSQTECPSCVEREKELAANPPAPPPPPVFAPPQAYQAAPQQTYQPPPQYPPQGYPQQHHWGPPPAKRGLPTWAMSLLFAAALLAVAGGVYYFTQPRGKTNPLEKAGLENPSNPSKAKVSNPLQKYVEVVGIRLLADSRKKPMAKFVVVNHANTEIEGLAANVTLWASTSRSEEDAVATFSFKLPRIGPGQSTELTEAIKTKLKIYELPDWQNSNADVQITAP